MLYPNGDIVVGGQTDSEGTDHPYFNETVAFTPQGQVDTAAPQALGYQGVGVFTDGGFGRDGRDTLLGLASLLVDATGRLVVVGWDGPSGDRRFRVSRTTLTGGIAIDNSFGCGSVSDPALGGSGLTWTATGAVLDLSGNIVVGGVQSTSTGSNFAAARYLNNDQANFCPYTGNGGGGNSGGGGGGGAAVAVVEAAGQSRTSVCS